MLETEVALWKPPAHLERGDDGLATLRGIPLFHELKDPELKRVAKLLHERHYEAGEVVFREGQTGAGMYIIKEGAVDIVLRLADGAEQSVVSLHAGQFFGELALLESSPRTATAVVRKPSVLLGLFQPDLEQLLDRDSKLGARVVWNLARMTGLRLRELSDLMRARAAADAEGAK
ncbi:MAG: cyclic nucleotide-binding domain-containing protein [Archangium sp.]|nr:cyclic nucleotide-binding domain-containing protein [Archangium sp.]MDP3151579.1 cyclic nucleotide-binding domain-containing protein [Archangium sp.]MDP3569114.1 cyclic nucleotide-binding domain-containing protein [Archangium sp.]